MLNTTCIFLFLIIVNLVVQLASADCQNKILYCLDSNEVRNGAINVSSWKIYIIRFIAYFFYRSVNVGNGRSLVVNPAKQALLTVELLAIRTIYIIVENFIQIPEKY